MGSPARRGRAPSPARRPCGQDPRRSPGLGRLPLLSSSGEGFPGQTGARDREAGPPAPAPVRMEFGRPRAARQHHGDGRAWPRTVAERGRGLQGPGGPVPGAGRGWRARACTSARAARGSDRVRSRATRRPRAGEHAGGRARSGPTPGDRAGASATRRRRSRRAPRCRGCRRPASVFARTGRRAAAWSSCGPGVSAGAVIGAEVTYPASSGISGWSNAAGSCCRAPATASRIPPSVIGVVFRGLVGVGGLRLGDVAGRTAPSQIGGLRRRRRTPGRGRCGRPAG